MSGDGGYYDKALGGWLPNDPKYCCDKCGEEVDNEDDLHEVWLDEFVCDGCYNDYVECDGCGHEVNVDEIEKVEGKEYCEDCRDEYVNKCAICGKEYYNEDSDIKICAKCFNELPNE